MQHLLSSCGVQSSAHGILACPTRASGKCRQGLLTCSMPPGAVILFAGKDTEIPCGFLDCAGQLLLKTEFPILYRIIGGQYGETADQFRLPQLMGILASSVPLKWLIRAV